MRRFNRNRGPSSAELIRQTNVRKLLCKYGAYSRHVSSKSSSSLECSSSMAQSSSSSRSSRLAASSIQLASATHRRAAEMIHEGGADLKSKPLNRPSQLVSSCCAAGMDKGLALAASQYVARILGTEEANGMDAQQLKEDFLHQLERDWGFAGAENLALGRIKITIKRRDNDLENIRRRAELEKSELEKSRLIQEKGVQLRTRRVEAVSSSHHVQSSTKVVKTRVVKTVKRTMQTVRAA